MVHSKQIKKLQNFPMKIPILFSFLRQIQFKVKQTEESYSIAGRGLQGFNSSGNYWQSTLRSKNSQNKKSCELL